MAEPLLEVRNLSKHFVRRRGMFGGAEVVKAVDDVSFEVNKGEAVGLVGESGCGKTTTGRAIVRATEPTSGSVLLHGEAGPVDVTKADASGLREARRRMQMVFQDPFSSLNPRMTVYEIVAEPLECYGVGSRADRRDKVAELLRTVGLGAGLMNRHPHSFSGGQRQRIGIARALALSPDLVVADEAVSALDVSIQAQVLNLFQDLQASLGLTYLFISHDLAVVEHLCDRVIVMYLGKVVEVARTEELFFDPRHPYVEALLSSVPRPDPHHRASGPPLSGEVADPANRPSGCPFHPRCPYAQEVCRQDEPALAPTGDDPGRLAACHFANELELQGVGGARGREA